MRNANSSFTPFSKQNMDEQIRVMYKGSNEDFIVFLDDMEAFKQYVSGDTSIPLSSVLGNFSVYRSITGNGSSGVLEAASKQQLSEEFGNYKSLEDEVIPKILKEGDVQNTRRQSQAN